MAAKRKAAKKPAVKKPAKLRLRAKKPAEPAKKPAITKKPETKKPATMRASKSKTVETITAPVEPKPSKKAPKAAPKLSPQQKAAITRKANREAKEAAEREAAEAAAKAAAEAAAKAAAEAAIALQKKEDRSVAARKGWETRRAVLAALEKGERVRIPKKQIKILQEKGLKSKNEQIRNLAKEVIQVQEAAVTPTEKIIDTLQRLRREAIENKVGAYPSKLNEAKYVEDDPARLAKIEAEKGIRLQDSPFTVQKKSKAGLGTWLEEVERTSTDANGKLVMRKFRYRRHHERIGEILTESEKDVDGNIIKEGSHDRILAKISKKYREMHAISAVVAAEANPNGTARGYVKIYGYTLAKSIDQTLIKAYAELVRLYPSDSDRDKRKHGMNRSRSRDRKHHKGVPIEDKVSGEKLAVIVDVSELSSDPNVVVEGVARGLWQWLHALSQAVIVDSFFISIEERDNAPPK